MKKLECVILDRDGVINLDSEHYIKNPNEWIPIPGSLEAITQLNQAGFLVVIATNQSGIGRGYFSSDELECIHQKMKLALEKVGGHIDAIFYCPHTPRDECDCRKPKPGLLYQIRDQYALSLKNAIFIGDSKRDKKAAEAAYCDFLEIASHPHIDRAFKNLKEAVKYILENYETKK